MNSKAGSFTPNTTGNVTVSNLTFLPVELEFSLGPPSGSATTGYTMYTRGWTTASNQSYDTFYQDGTRFRMQAGTDKCISLYKWNSSTSTYDEVMAATFVSFNTNTPTNFGFTLNFTAYSQQIRYIARG